MIGKMAYCQCSLLLLFLLKVVLLLVLHTSDLDIWSIEARLHMHRATVLSHRYLFCELLPKGQSFFSSWYHFASLEFAECHHTLLW